MNTSADKIPEKKSQAVANSLPKQLRSSQSTLQFAGNRPETIAQRNLKEAINKSSHLQQLKTYQQMADNTLQQKNSNTPETSLQSTKVVQCVFETPAGGTISTVAWSPSHTAILSYVEANKNSPLLTSLNGTDLSLSYDLTNFPRYLLGGNNVQGVYLTLHIHNYGIAGQVFGRSWVINNNRSSVEFIQPENIAFLSNVSTYAAIGARNLVQPAAQRAMANNFAQIADGLPTPDPIFYDPLYSFDYYLPNSTKVSVITNMTNGVQRLKVSSYGQILYNANIHGIAGPFNRLINTTSVTSIKESERIKSDMRSARRVFYA